MTNIAKFSRLMVVVLVAWYLVLCTQHYFNQRLLWNDELCVFKSIQNFNTLDFFVTPLYDIQVFPRLYLLTIQSVSRFFDWHILSLRFLPFVCMVASFFLWLVIVRRHLENTWSFLVYILCWAGSINMIYYAAELKQYSMDVLVAALFTMFLCFGEGVKARWSKLYFLILFALAFFAFFSYIAFLFMVIVFYNLAIEAWRQKRFCVSAVCYGVLCVIVFLVSHAIDMRFTPRDVYSQQGHGAYFIYFDSIQTFFETVGEGINNLFSRWYAETPKVFRKMARFFAIFGLFQICVLFFRDFKKDGFKICSLNTLGFVLFMEQIALAALHKYPFGEPRTSLFFAPIVFYVTVQGICSVASFNKPLYRTILTLFVVFLLVVSFGLARNIFILGDLGAQSTIWN